MELKRHAALLVVIAGALVAQDQGTLPQVISNQRPVTMTLEAGWDDCLLQVDLELAGAASWGESGHSSTVIAVDVDGEHTADLVVCAERVPYSLLLGPLGAGPHELVLRVSPHSRGPGSIQVRSVATTAAVAARDLHAPILVTRSGTRDGLPLAAVSDTPLLLYVDEQPRGDGVRLVYSVVFSNEDGGTGWQPALLMARWGRTADIEWMFVVDLDADGRVLHETYQSPGHGNSPFTGAHIGQRPILQVATDNNNFQATLEEAEGQTLRWSPAPLLLDKDLHPRDRIMDEHPFTHRMANAEMRREFDLGLELLGVPKQESPGDATTPKISDLRNYVFVDSHISDNAHGGLRFSACVDGEWYDSDHQRPLLTYRQNGWGRTAIELPPEARGRAIMAIGMFAPQIRPGSAPVKIYRARFFRLDDDFAVRRGAVELEPDSSERDTMVVLTPADPGVIIEFEGAFAPESPRIRDREAEKKRDR